MAAHPADPLISPSSPESADPETWALYVEALRQGLNVPPGATFLTSPVAQPLALNTATTIDPVPPPQALATVYRLANAMPRWSPIYQPAISGQVFAEYKAYVFAILVPPDGGEPYRPVWEARALLFEVDAQIQAGSGSLVMTIQTDSGTSVVPRFESGPLGVPGYSDWLETAILAVAYGLPPKIDVTVTGPVEPESRSGSAAASPPPFFAAAPPLDAVLAGEITTLRLTIQSATYLPLWPGQWFVSSLLRAFTQPQQFAPGTPFAKGPIWGPDGIFNLIPTGIYAGFRPEVTVTLSPEGFARLAAAREKGEPLPLRVGPFTVDLGAPEADASTTPEAGGTSAGTGTILRLDPASSTAFWADLSLQGKLLAVTADHPNYPTGP